MLLVHAGSLEASTTAELLQKGESNLSLGKLATADQAFRDALRAALKEKERKDEAAARNGIARVFPGNRWESLGHLQLALAIHRQLKDGRGEASDLARMGEIDLLHGYHMKAIASLTEAAAIQERLGLAEERAATLENLGVVLQSTGAYEEAATNLTAALELRRRASIPTFELVRVEVRLARLQTLLGLDESAAEHLQAARKTIQQFRARFPEKKWNAMRDAWVKHGRGFMKNMGPMAANLGEAIANGTVPMQNDDVELLDAVGPEIERLGRGQDPPDDAPKLPDRKTDFFTTDKDEGRAAPEARSHWREFLETHAEELASHTSESGTGDAVTWIVDEVIDFNDKTASHFDFDPPTDATLDEEARDINRLLRENHVKGSVTRKSIASRTTDRAEGVAASDPRKMSRRMTAAAFIAMTNQVMRWVLQQMDDVRNDLLQEFPPADVVMAEKIWAAQPCEIEIESNLQHIFQLQGGNEEEARTANKLSWKMLDDQTALFSKLGGTAAAKGVDEQRRAARELGLAIPPVFTNPCDGVLTSTKSTLWDADVAAARGKIGDAIRDYNIAAGSSPAMRATALTRIAFLHDKSGDKQKAIEAYKQAIDAVEAVQGRLRLDDLVTSWAGQQAPLYSRAIALLQESGRAEQAFNYAERARARAFLNQIGNRHLPRAVQPQLAAELYDVRGQLIALESSQPSAMPQLPLPNALGDAADPRALDRERLQKRYGELLGRLAQSNPGYLSLVQVETVNVATLQREVLPANTTLIEYFVLDDRTIAWVIDREKMRSVELKISADKLHERVDYFRNLIKSRQPETVDTASELYGTLFAPLRALLRNANLIIIPHASLHYLPFAALRNAEQKRYLIEDYAITIAPSASALRFMKASGKRSSSLLALGDPDRTLPHAEEEARSVAKMYGVSAFVGKDATESRLRNDAGRAGFLHVAAHAHYDAQRPLFSRIDLAPSGGDEATDGKLHVYEVYELDLSSTRLAVLSACDTALAPRSNGDDLVALTRAFLTAGTPAVMTTLWSVDDASTAELVVQFYERLRKGSSPAKALQEAQVKMLSRDAYDWSSFVLAGDGR
jgi:CHAT domain-containing protein